jgi:hypothetical protein
LKAAGHVEAILGIAARHDSSRGRSSFISLLKKKAKLYGKSQQISREQLIFWSKGT